VKRLIFILSLLPLGLWAQESPWQFQGYLKYLGSYSHLNANFYPESLRPGLKVDNYDQLIHNRFDLKYYKGHWSGALSMRNRLFQGASPAQGDAFMDALETDAGLVDLSFLYWRSDEVLLHTIFDRAWLQYEFKNGNIRLGRQRINWGINTIFNPNDILNQYNFFDFDYEERPGTDAVRVQWFPSFDSQLELALAPAKEIAQSTAALRYRNNALTYDLQGIAGYFKDNLTLGAGWAGNIWDLGFKGEFNYYWPLNDLQQEAWVFSTGLDYVLSNGLYISAGYLYNQSAPQEGGIGDFGQLGAGQVLSPKNPFIFQHTAIVNSNYAFNPLFNGSFTLMYSPDAHSTIVFPSLSYSLSTNLDLMLAGQFFLSDNPIENDYWQWLVSATYLRLKWSF
tara:strand:+ start:370 stop:1551 length:1182 start_codon:yes stop_codon:yes gene_type:complete